MKLTIKWVATILTIVLLTAMFIEVVPPAQKYRPVDIAGRSNLFESYDDHQWSTQQLTRSLLLVLYGMIVVMAIWVVPETSWLGLYLERKRAEQRARIAEAEAKIAKHKKDAIKESTNP